MTCSDDGVSPNEMFSVKSMIYVIVQYILVKISVVCAGTLSALFVCYVLVNFQLLPGVHRFGAFIRIV